MRKLGSLLLLISLSTNIFAGLSFVRSNGITVTGADGISYVGVSGITLTGADGLLPFRSNGITLTGADGVALTGLDSVSHTAADGATYIGPNGITLTGADGITLTGADGITLTGADGITVTGADGTTYTANSIIIRRPNGITLTGADGITLTGADAAAQTAPDAVHMAHASGITLTGADGITLTGADGITLTGADAVTGIGPAGVIFENSDPTGITLTGADGITLTGADGTSVTGADGITLTGADARTIIDAASGIGLQGLDPELAVRLNSITDDSSVNAVIVYHRAVTEGDLNALRNMGILGGTRMRRLPMIYVSATKAQLVAVSRLGTVRSIYGNRTLSFSSDPYFNATGIGRVASDTELRTHNAGLSVTGRDVTVAVLDTGINALHPDLAGKVVQNVRLADVQSVPPGFAYPFPTENLANTDPIAGHGTFVAGIIAGSGAASAGRYAGVAPGARLLGLAAGDLSLVNVLSGFDYLLERGGGYNVRVVNCSFSANTAYDTHDPVNIATRMLADGGVSVVFSAGNTGPGNGTLNPYAAAPWVVGVGATDALSRLASFSSRGDLGDALQHPLVAAPGVSVIGPRSLPGTTGVGGVGGSDPQRLSVNELPYYTTASGTSFSAPQVAGAIALMLDVAPTLSPGAIRDILGRTATPLPKYFYHEAGAGMLNTHAAVLDAAFPERRIGIFRSTYSRNRVRLVTSNVSMFQNVVSAHAPTVVNVSLPADTVETTVSIGWGLGTNDFGLRVFDTGGALLGQSNMLNLPGITGRLERVASRRPGTSIVAEIRNSLPVGTAQTVSGSVRATRAEYPDIVDLAGLPADAALSIRESMLSSLLIADGRRFWPTGAVTRAELAEALLRTGVVPQYVAAAPMFTDVRDRLTRNVVESVQSAPSGRLFPDASAGMRFYPYSSANRLVAAVALVRAAGLEHLTTSTALPASVTDAAAIPAQYRGHVAVALEHGLLRLNGQSFAPAQALTRVDLALAVQRLLNRD